MSTSTTSEECEVCRAALAFVRASDGMRNFLNSGGVAGREEPRAEALKLARSDWAYARGLRHTGIVHTPVVTP